MILNILKTSKNVTFTTFLLLITCAMFIMTVLLSFKLLMIDDCTYSGQASQEVAKHRRPSSKQAGSNGQHKLAVLVPYRDRFEELLEFVPYTHSFLNRQDIKHKIFILNQVDTYRFNRGSLINVGYILTQQDYDYMAMHDVDLLPLNNNLTYKYPQEPFHLAAPTLHPRYHYEKFIGGILLINREHFKLVDGLSNRYWGWGLEDDEFYVRLRDANLNVTRPDNISTGIHDTFRHIHGKERKRDTTKCFNQREVTRRRDRQTGLHDVKYSILGKRSMLIDEAPCTIYNIELICDRNLTPWCDCSVEKKKQKPT